MNLFSYDTNIKIKLALVTVVVLAFSCFPVKADEVSDLNAQKAANQKKLDAINAQIKSFQQQISDTQKKAATLQNEVAIYDKQIASTELQIQATQTEIEDTNLQITELEKLIQQKTQEISNNKKILADLLAQINEFNDQYTLNTTLGSKNLSEFLDQIQATQNFQDKIFQVEQKIKKLKERKVSISRQNIYNIVVPGQLG